MVTTIKFLTEAQAREIRKSITDSLGSRKNVFPRKGIWIIVNPLDNPQLEYKGDGYAEFDIDTPSLVFVAGRDKIRRGIPTIEMLKDTHYIVYPHGKYKWGQYQRVL